MTFAEWNEEEDLELAESPLRDFSLFDAGDAGGRAGAPTTEGFDLWSDDDGQ